MICIITNEIMYVIANSNYTGFIIIGLWESFSEINYPLGKITSHFYMTSLIYVNFQIR